MTEMNQDTLSVQTDALAQPHDQPSWVLVIVLQAASLGVGWGLWILLRWLYVSKPVDAYLGICLLVATALACAFFIFLGTVAPDRVVTTVWKKMGKGILYILMFA